MASIEKLALKAETAGKNPRPRWFRARYLPTIAGAALPSGAILWAHGENYADNASVYLTQPPTVSRALINPEVTDIFAIIMIVGAVLLYIAAWQIIRAMTHLLRDQKADWLSWLLLIFSAICEVPAILGMVVLSQYTGDAWSWQHNMGSYMLFFGHSFAISASGWMIYRLISRQGALHDNRILALNGLPRHAAWTAAFSFLFGVSYFSNRVWPDVAPFWQHLVLSAVEMVVLVLFLSYLGRFWRLLEASRV
jgi:hypothetical protein